ncbi:S-adenosyl-L-methionine-dependent methyltransferase [Cyathus striatus]|nr:S-adenosyl-L-methionine-dependent methyltransferase [Cyathus striatus]
MAQPVIDFQTSNTSINIGRSNVESLLSQISSATRDAMKIYEGSGYGIPCPNSPIPHQLDAVYDLVNLKQVIGVLEGACNQLCLTLSPPAHTMGNRMTMPIEPACIRVASQAKVADILLEYPCGLPVEELGRQTSINSEKLARILRLLAGRGCFKEVSKNVFTNTRLSLTLLSSNPISSSVKLFTDDFNKGLALLNECLTDTEFGASHEPEKSPFMFSLKDKMCDRVMWDWYQLHPEDGQHFGRGMVGWSNVTGAMAALQCPIWGELPPGSSICDIGSGVGGFTINLARAYPQLKITLCDRPETIVQAEQFWAANYPEAINEKRVTFIPVDIFEKAVGGHDVYYARHVIHNWRDPKATTLLRNIRKVMQKDTKLFQAEEYVLPHTRDTNLHSEVNGSSEQIFHPGSIKLFNLDIMMMVALNAKERTISEYENLGSNAGLHLTKHWEFAETSLLEYHITEPYHTPLSPHL